MWNRIGICSYFGIANVKLIVDTVKYFLGIFESLMVNFSDFLDFLFCEFEFLF